MRIAISGVYRPHRIASCTYSAYQGLNRHALTLIATVFAAHQLLAAICAHSPHIHRIVLAWPRHLRRFNALPKVPPLCFSFHPISSKALCAFLVCRIIVGQYVDTELIWDEMYTFPGIRRPQKMVKNTGRFIRDARERTARSSMRGTHDAI